MGNRNLSPEALALRLFVACVAIYSSSVVYVVVGTALVRTRTIEPALTGDSANMLGIVFVAAGIVMALASFFFRRLIESRLLADAPPAQRLTPIVVALVFAESAGVLGLVYAILCGTLAIPYILWGCSLGVGIFHLPSRSSFARKD